MACNNRMKSAKIDRIYSADLADARTSTSVMKWMAVAPAQTPSSEKTIVTDGEPEVMIAQVQLLLCQSLWLERRLGDIVHLFNLVPP